MVESKSETIAVKKTALMAFLFVFGLVVGAFLGYYFGVQNTIKLTSSSGNQIANPGNSGTGISITREDLFLKYADDLKLDKAKFSSCVKNSKYANDINSDYQTAVSIGAEGTPSFVVNGQFVPIGASPYSEFKKVLDGELANSTNRSLALSLVKPNDPTLGKKDAPIVMIEFSDFQCPFCGKFFNEAEKDIMKDYVDTGKVLFVYKDFPLKQIHPMAQKAAEAANCANEQGKFWEYHNTLFSTQIEWAR